MNRSPSVDGPALDLPSLRKLGCHGSSGLASFYLGGRTYITGYVREAFVRTSVACRKLERGCLAIVEARQTGAERRWCRDAGLSDWCGMGEGVEHAWIPKFPGFKIRHLPSLQVAHDKAFSHVLSTAAQVSLRGRRLNFTEYRYARNVDDDMGRTGSSSASCLHSSVSEPTNHRRDCSIRAIYP